MTARTSGRLDGQLRRCPFGVEIEAKIAATGSADIRLYGGDPAHRWTRALARRALVGPGTATLLPLGADPLSLRWPSCPIVGDVTALDGATVRRLAEALIRDGCGLAFLTDTQRGDTLRIVPEAL